jgi:acyl-CoA thioester hydrolase
MEVPPGCKFRCSGIAGRGEYAGRVHEPFRHRMRVRWSECDLQGVVFYAHYLGYFDIAMTELWREVVIPHGEMMETGADMVVAEARISYRASARFDDEIELVAQVTSLGTTSMTTALRIERAPDAELLVEGELHHVFVDPQTLQKREIPAAVREVLATGAPEDVAQEA